MRLTETIHAGRTHVSLAGDVTIFFVAGAKAQLLQYVHDYAYLEVDLEEVASMDMAGLQLLMMLKNEGQKKSHTIVFSTHSQAIKALAALLHLDEFFDLDEKSQ